MKCDFCRFAPPVNSEGYQDECSLFDLYGKVWKDGREGCTCSYQTLAKNERIHDRALGDYATAWGLEHDFGNHGWDVNKTIESCKHMIGFHKSSVYHRHGRAFYKAYRNYWCGEPREDFDYMCHKSFGLMEYRDSAQYRYYYLTEAGLRWLGNKLSVVIKEKE